MNVPRVFETGQSLLRRLRERLPLDGRAHARLRTGLYTRAGTKFV